MLLRKSEERGKNNISWLNANHTFSFGHYYDPKWTHFHQLLVINEDTIAPSMGFGTHPHNDMEILTYVIKGKIRHRDSMGNLGFISPGEIQVMSAGTGVTHSEHNDLADSPTHLLQIWVHPIKEHLPPRYDQKKVFDQQSTQLFKVIATTKNDVNNISDEVVTLNAEAKFHLGRFEKEASLSFSPTLYKNFWIQLIDGNLSIDDIQMKNGDGLGVSAKAAQVFELKIGANGAHFLIIEVNN